MDSNQLGSSIGICSNILHHAVKVVLNKATEHGRQHKTLKLELVMGAFHFNINKMDNLIQCLQGTSQYTEGVGNSPRFTNSLLGVRNT